MKGKILIVEDEPNIVHVLSSILAANDYQPVVARDGEEALTEARAQLPDVVLLDLGLPGMDGVDVIRHLRQWYRKPIVILSARIEEQEKVKALDFGADDYITKPFGTGELLARIRVAMRNSRKAAQEEEAPQADSYAVGDFVIDFGRHLVTVEGTPVHLTQNEFKIVELLARQPGKVLTYDYLMERIWGPYLPENNKILRVNMAHIRRKLEKYPAEPQYILTEMGIGYRMASGEDPD